MRSNFIFTYNIAYMYNSHRSILVYLSTAMVILQYICGLNFCSVILSRWAVFQRDLMHFEECEFCTLVTDEALKVLKDNTVRCEIAIFIAEFSKQTHFFLLYLCLCGAFMRVGIKIGELQKYEWGTAGALAVVPVHARRLTAKRKGFYEISLGWLTWNTLNDAWDCMLPVRLTSRYNYSYLSLPYRRHCRRSFFCAGHVKG